MRYFFIILPFVTGHWCFSPQQYSNSKMSHKGEYALDFKVKKKTKICAAREGVVIATRDDSDKGGLKPGNISEGNHISIRHMTDLLRITGIL